jgi:hypothetical protein
MTGALAATTPTLPEAPRLPPAAWPVLTAAVILAAAAVNVAYLAADCPLDLAPDEAHYWDWSRHLDWCYYSKGPLVAWLIRASRELVGGLGPAVLAVRLPAVLCQAAALAAVYTLASRCLRSPKLGLATVLVSLTLPPVAAAGVVMTIDPPFLACWAWACVFAHSAVLRNGGAKMWVAAGGVAAVGVLAKYTMLLFPACVAAYLWAVPGRRTEFRKPGFWLLGGLTAAGLLPIIYWNASNDWVGLRHLAALANGPTHKPRPFLDPLGLPAYLGGQFVLLVGFWFAAFAAAAWTHRPGRCAGRHTAFLWWLSVPLWLFFAAASIRTQGQPNWPAPAYITGIVLAVGWVADRWADGLQRKWLIRGVALSSVAGLIAIFCAHYPAVVRPLLAELARRPTPERPAPVRQLDPTCRLAGWTTLAAAVDDLRDRVTREDGQEPVLSGMVWTTPGELGFYCRGNPQAYSVGVRVDDRHSQYDVWRPNPVADAQAFRGRTFLYVGERMPEMDRVFGRVESPVEVVASDGGIPVAAWKVWVCRDFRGFPAGDGRRAGRGF